MSRRNSRVAKARRRAERGERARSQSLVEAMDGAEFFRAVAEHETLPCGCDAHDLLNGEWEVDGDPDVIEFLFPRE